VIAATLFQVRATQIGQLRQAMATITMELAAATAARQRAMQAAAVIMQ